MGCRGNRLNTEGVAADLFPMGVESSIEPERPRPKIIALSMAIAAGLGLLVVGIGVTDPESATAVSGDQQGRSAEGSGFGVTIGGAGGDRVLVTSLADSGPGTLREALSGSHRTVTFAVAGTIRLSTPIQIRGREFVTVNGATAPRPGVTLTGSGIVVRGSRHVVLRGLRIRDTSDDNISVAYGARHVLIEHCSLANAGDGNLDITEGSADVTVAWTLMGDTRQQGSAVRSKGMLIANFNDDPVTRVSLHHNAWISIPQRNPQVSTPGLVDMRNNLIAEWEAYGMRARQGAFGNLIGNVFRSSRKPTAAVIIAPDAGAWHIDTNITQAGVDLSGLSGADAYAVPPVTSERAGSVRRSVKKRAGVLPRDAVDRWLLRRA